MTQPSIYKAVVQFHNKITISSQGCSIHLHDSLCYHKVALLMYTHIVYMAQYIKLICMHAHKWCGLYIQLCTSVENILQIHMNIICSLGSTVITNHLVCPCVSVKITRGMEFHEASRMSCAQLYMVMSEHHLSNEKLYFMQISWLKV